MANIKSKRLFISFNLPTKVKDFLNTYIDKLKIDKPGIKRVRPETLHITLHFLSTCDESQENKIQDVLKHNTNQTGPIEFNCLRLSAFPSSKRPRVINFACEEIDGHQAQALQQKIGDALITAKIKIVKKPWHPHIAVARIKRPGLITLPHVNDFPSFVFKVTSYELMSSELLPGGARHKIEKSYPL